MTESVNLVLLVLAVAVLAVPVGAMVVKIVRNNEEQKDPLPGRPTSNDQR